MYSSEEKQMGMVAHIGPIVVSLFSALGWIVALILYFVYKDKSRFIAFHALQSMYFQAFIFVLVVICFATCIGIAAVPVIAIGALVVSILAGVKAYAGEVWEYPVVGAMARKAVGI